MDQPEAWLNPGQKNARSPARLCVGVHCNGIISEIIWRSCFSSSTLSDAGPIKQTERSVQVHVCMQSVIRVSDCTLHILMPVLLFVCCVVGVSHAHAQKVVRKYYRDHRCLTDLVRCVVIHSTVLFSHYMCVTHARARAHTVTH